MVLVDAYGDRPGHDDTASTRRDNFVPRICVPVTRGRGSQRLLQILLTFAQLPDAVLQKHRVVVNRLVVLVPAHIAATIVRPRLVHAAQPVFGQVLAGLEAFLDALLALLRYLKDVSLLELRHGQAEMFRQPPDIGAAYIDVARHTA